MNQTAKTGVSAYLTKHMRDYGLLFALIAIMVFFQIVTDGTLLKPVNITNLFLQNSYIIIMALGMLIVIVSGNIDLSVGSVMGFVGVLIAYLQYIETAPSVGGYSLGSLGPVSEGLFIWIFGLGAIVGITIWLTARSN